MRPARFLAVALVPLAACHGSPSPGGERDVAVSRSAVTAPALPIVSPDTCTHAEGRLYACAVAPTAFTAPSLDVSAVPLRTVLQRRRQGDCSSPMALSVQATADNLPPVSFHVTEDDHMALRHKDGTAVQVIALQDASSATRFASFNDSCRLGVDITWNEPDVDSTAEAQSLVAALEARATALDVELARLEELALLDPAYRLLRVVVDDFHAELTDATLLALRDAARSGSDPLAQLIASCGLGIPPASRAALVHLAAAVRLATDGADAWRRPDGSPKTLADLLGGRNVDTLRVLDDLLASKAAAPVDPAALLDAQRVCAAAHGAVSLARQQLASWLQASSAPPDGGTVPSP